MIDVQKHIDNDSTVIPKRKYQKQKAGSKITVKHYLNTRLKGRGGVAFPLYVQVIHRQKSYGIKSFFNAYCEVKNFDTFRSKNIQDLDFERQFITDQVAIISEKQKDDFSLKNFTGSDEELFQIIEKNLKREIFDAVLLTDEKAKQLIVDNITGKVIGEDPSDSTYMKMLAEKSPILKVLDSDADSDNLLDVFVRIINNNHTLNKLKNDFLKEKDWYSLFIKPFANDQLDFNMLASSSALTLGSWKIGFAQARLRRMYKDTVYEQISEEYIQSINGLFERNEI